MPDLILNRKTMMMIIVVKLSKLIFCYTLSLYKRIRGVDNENQKLKTGNNEKFGMKCSSYSSIVNSNDSGDMSKRVTTFYQV